MSLRLQDHSATLGKPALLGGEPVVPDPRSHEAMFHWPIVTREDEQAVIEVLRAGTMSGTAITKCFEAEFAQWIGSRYALGYCNGTASILAAMWACGVGAGDEIICPSMTYWASAGPALTLGAAVNFADIQPHTLCLDPNDIEHRIGERTRAIVVVHYGGHPADMDPIMAIARKHDVRVIEDVSHAHGAVYKGLRCGTIGDIGAMSMMAGKPFAIGEAGMLVTNDAELYERAIAFGHYERTGGPSRYADADSAVHGNLSRFRGAPIGGCKHRMNQTCAAMGRVQLQYYDERNAEIRRAMDYFWDLLEDVPGIHAHRCRQLENPESPVSTMGGWYLPRGLYDGAALGGLPCERFCEAVRAEGVSACYPGANDPLHLHPVFYAADLLHQGKPTVLAFGQRDVRQGAGTLPVSERITQIAFGVPWFKHYDEDIIDRYALAFRKVVEFADQIISPAGEGR